MRPASLLTMQRTRRGLTPTGMGRLPVVEEGSQ